MNNLVGIIREKNSEIIKLRRELHEIPELGFDLPKTTGYIKSKLEEYGIEYIDKVGISGIVGLIKGGKEGNTIALRADMDALKIIEETGQPFSSKNNNMHACGHDAHMAMLLAASKILNENRNDISGNIKLIFQPAEEGPGGAKLMIEEGVLENPKVDRIIGLHIGSMFDEVGTGQIGYSYGTVQACLDDFYIKIKGKGAHGALPHTGIDPIAITAQIISSLQTIISRNMQPTRAGVLTIGTLKGGTAYNVIPDFVEMTGTVRAFFEEDRKKISSNMESIISGVSKGLGGDYEYNYRFGYPPTINDPEFTKSVLPSIKEIVDEDDIVELQEPTMGGEDFAYYLQEIPGTYLYLGSNNPEKGIVYPHHNSKFDIDEDVLWKGTALLVKASMNYLNNK